MLSTNKQKQNTQTFNMALKMQGAKQKMRKTKTNER